MIAGLDLNRECSMIRGRMSIRYTGGRTEAISGGQAYDLAPGHNAVVDEDCELVEFTPAGQSPDMHR